jgi:uncharacterized phiE125 gp8 family phage protein
MLQLNYENLTVTSAPASEPVTVDEAKDHLRVDITDDDTLIGNLITAAREYVELFTGRSFIQRTYRADLADFASAIRLPRGPVISIGSVAYYDTSSPEALTTWAASNYYLHNDIFIRRDGVSFPSVGSRADNVQITYTAGMLDNASPRADATPKAICQAILLLVGGLYENRETEVLYPGQMLETKTFQMLLNPYRNHR